MKCFLFKEGKINNNPNNKLSNVKQAKQSSKKMSIQRNSSKKATTTVVKKHCKVCFDAGKPESEYTSHWVRSSPGPEGNVICPTLLSQECKFCFESGHTVKFCKVLEKNNKEKAKEERKKAQPQTENKNKPTNANVTKKQTNVFASLMESSSDDEGKPIEKAKEEFPMLCQPKKTLAPAAAATTFSYASMAAKTEGDYDNEQFLKTIVDKRALPPAPTKAATASASATIAKKNWADWSDDEEEEYLPIVTRQPIPFKKASEIDWAQEYDSDDSDYDF